MNIETTERIVDAAARYEEGVKNVEAVPIQSRREKYLSRNLARTKANLLATEAVVGLSGRSFIFGTRRPGLT